jgi:AraC-like DNA-binding protein
MPIYLDYHFVPNVTAQDVAEAHALDVLLEKEYGCKCLTYWFDELRSNAFCLIDAPDEKHVMGLHSRSHGLLPNKIIEVETDLVHGFLGRITDPENTRFTDTGLKILDETAYRIIMNIKIADVVLLEHFYGRSNAVELITLFHTVAGSEILKCGGTEVSSTGNEMIASYVSGDQAFAAACSILDQLDNAGALELHIGIHAGEPVKQTNILFGDTLQMLKRMNFVNSDRVIHITAAVKELLSKGHLTAGIQTFLTYTPQDETFLTRLFDTLEKKYGEEDFNVEECAHAVDMSKSQLFRKTIAICGLSPNDLLKEYRLDKARDLMRRKDKTVSEIAFDTGFASPSYFTKCFKNRFRMLPTYYMALSR